jgi:hypothetical protein
MERVVQESGNQYAISPPVPRLCHCLFVSGIFLSQQETPTQDELVDPILGPDLLQLKGLERHAVAVRAGLVEWSPVHFPRVLVIGGGTLVLQFLQLVLQIRSTFHSRLYQVFDRVMRL